MDSEPFSFTVDGVDVSIVRVAGGLLAEATAVRVRYSSGAVEAEFLGDEVTRDQLAEMHRMFPPRLRRGADAIVVTYELPFLRRTLEFRLKRAEPAGIEEIARVQHEVLQLRQEVEQLRQRLSSVEQERREAAVVEIIGTRDGRILFRSSDLEAREYLLRLLQLTYHATLYDGSSNGRSWRSAYRGVEELFMRYAELGYTNSGGGRSWPYVFEELGRAFDGCAPVRYHRYVPSGFEGRSAGISPVVLLCQEHKCDEVCMAKAIVSHMWRYKVYYTDVHANDPQLIADILKHKYDIGGDQPRTKVVVQKNGKPVDAHVVWNVPAGVKWSIC